MRKKRVLLDGYNLALETGTGVATYARNLSYILKDMGFEVDILYGIKRPPMRNNVIKEITFFDPDNVGTPTILTRMIYSMQDYMGISSIPYEIPITGTVIYETYKSRMPKFDKIYNVRNVFGRSYKYFKKRRKMLTIVNSPKSNFSHFTYPIPIRVRGSKNIYTIHDLVPLRLPYTTLDIKTNYYKMIKAVIKKAYKIATVSECSKKDIINIFNIPEEKIINTYQSVYIPPKYLNKSAKEVSDEIKGVFDLNYKEYILFYGAIEPKKNIGRLIEGYLASGVDIPLVIVGKKAWKSDKELRMLHDDLIVTYFITDKKEIKVNKKIHIFDYVSFSLLVSLIKGARFICFPSIYEGFGLPVLEAMICDTPVMTSNVSSLPEVAGDAALLIDPYNVREIKEGIIELTHNKNLRSELVNKGRHQREKFSPEKYMERLQKLYK